MSTDPRSANSVAAIGTASPSQKPVADHADFEMLPAPGDPTREDFRTSRHGLPSWIWIYRNHLGAPVAAAVRFDMPTGSKIVVPRTYGRKRAVKDGGAAEGDIRWHMNAMPEPRLIYNLHQIVGRTEADVLVVEGEKAADAAAVLFPALVATTSPSGSNAARKASWAALVGRNVIIWPDNDEPGRKYAADVIDLLKTAGAASVRIVSVPSAWPVGWDLADEPPDGIDKATLKRMLEEAPYAIKPEIHIEPGALHQVVDHAERVLAGLGRYYQSGGVIVAVSVDPITGEPKTDLATEAQLTTVLSSAARWLTPKREAWHDCDPPARHLKCLVGGQQFHHLSVLGGIARQPYFRPTDARLILSPGYDPVSKILGVFDGDQFSEPAASPEDARAALGLLKSLLSEFAFVSDADEAAAIAAMMTAAVRPSLPVAPAFHVHAPVFGSGKSYLCQIITAFAGPGDSHRVSYPPTSDEATKTILSLLLERPAVVEFDDMTTDWIPHGVINRMLTSESITDRILRVSRTATVSTRTLVLGSGNNVGPVRDLLRRVLTIHLDPETATPATKEYAANPLTEVRQQRGLYVTAALSIIKAWQAAGSPRSDVSPIASYGGVWADYCRHPLIWLGLPDPATGLLQQLAEDPDAAALGILLAEWWRAFGSAATTIRRAVDDAYQRCPDLLDAMRQLPVTDRNEINHNKLGWFLKRSQSRVVSGLKIQAAKSDGRQAWRVVIQADATTVGEAEGDWEAEL
jgi:hypothetical protein